MNDIEDENPNSFHILDLLMSHNSRFQKLAKQFSEEKVEFAMTIYTNIVKEAFQFYVNSGMDPTELLQFSFVNMPLAVINNVN
jgi:hypothetical protein